MAFNTGTAAGPSSEINVTPLIDVLLVLLIIFMVIVPLTPHGLDSALPQNKATTQAGQPAIVELRAGILPGAVVYRVNQRDVARDAVGSVLRGIFSVQAERTVILEADRNLTYESVALMVGDAKRAGAGAIVLSGSAKP